MSFRLFTDLFKDVTSQGVHATTAIGNERGRKKKPTTFSVMADGKPIETGGEVAMADFDKAHVVKVDADLGLVFGFAIVCKRDGKPYFDLQDDHITEKAMLEAATDFMIHSRVSKDMHVGDADGTVVFAFPLTSDIAKSLKIETEQTGLLIAMKPSPEVLAKYKSGDYTGFSIGGSRIKDEVL
jgi:Putative phage serine protease XkdF